MDKKTKKMTKYFAVRKRLSEHEDDDVVARLGKRLKTDARISDDDQTVPDTDDKENIVYIEPVASSSTRRKRVCNKQQRNKTAICSPVIRVEPTELGALSRLPAEIIFYFFGQSEIRTLVSLSLSSPMLRQLLQSYIFRADCRKRFAIETKAAVLDADKGTVRDPFTNWGALFKLLTCAFRTSDRIDIVRKFYMENRAVGDQAGWGRLFIKMVAGWDFAECAKVLAAVLKFDEGLVERTIDLVLQEPFGTRKEEEMRVREMLRATFLDHKFDDIRDYPFWTSALLRTRRTVDEQARLLMLLYAPTRVVNNNTEIDWKSLCNVAVTTMADGRERVAPFATALNSLLLTKIHSIRNYKWCEHEVFALMEEVTTFPEPWALDNFSALMLFRSALAPIALASRCLHFFEQEAGQIVNTMKTLAYRWRLSPAVTVAHPLLSTLHKLPLLDTRRIFFESICSAYHTRISHLIYDNSPNAHRELAEEINSAPYLGQVMSMLVAHI